ncbi:MAG TPA: hypothetical protein VM901_03495 [Bdellovibrionota bacterium]|jgi:hypothetical protein|nr:hypothetical protein [Bdellovibrionota bacterium]
MDSNSKKFSPGKSPNVFMWIYSVFAWFVSPTYACDLWEKWETEKKAREGNKA